MRRAAVRSVLCCPVSFFSCGRILPPNVERSTFSVIAASLQPTCVSTVVLSHAMCRERLSTRVAARTVAPPRSRLLVFSWILRKARALFALLRRFCAAQPCSEGSVSNQRHRVTFSSSTPFDFASPSAGSSPLIVEFGRAAFHTERHLLRGPSCPRT